MPDENRRDYYERRRSQMDEEFSSFLSHYKDLSQNINPRRGRFEVSDRNRGEKRHRAIINSHGTQALNTAKAGMFAGVMSPSRPWFELSTPDPGLREFRPVKLWLHEHTVRMNLIFEASNLYTMAPVLLGELLQFGTGCMTQLDDKDTLAHFQAHTVGSYRIAQDNRFNVNTLVRHYEMTAEQMALEFEYKNLSQSVKTALDRSNYGSWFPVVHFIEPNDDFRPQSPFARHKPFKSIKYEPGNNDKDMYLSQSGFDEFPAYCPRWDVTGEDIYGTDCPGMTTLGDIKQLQIMEKRKAQAIDKKVNPPMSGPGSLKNKPVQGVPGGFTIYDADPSRNKLEPLYEVNLDLRDLKEDIVKLERRIDRAFFVDLFLAISNMEGIQPRNELELSERNAERLLQLGPVLQRTHTDFLNKMIERTFNQMLRSPDELVSPPPKELQDQPLKIEYVSSLAKAQRSVDTRNINQLTGFIAGLLDMGVTDGRKLDADAAIQEYGDLIGVPPKLLRASKDVQAERQDEQRKQQMAESMALAEQGARAAAAAGQVDLSGDNPVSRGVDALNSITQPG